MRDFIKLMDETMAGSYMDTEYQFDSGISKVV